MKKKISVFLTAAILFVHTVSAFETPDMVAVDVSGTELQPYCLSITEVTQSLYFEIMGNNPSSCVQETAAFEKMLAGEIQENRPVETLTFFDAMQFCNLLTEKTIGKAQCVYTLSGPVYDSMGHIIRFNDVKADFSKPGYRLPTMEEWLNAAGTEPASPAMYAWYVDNSAARGEGRTGFGTHAVAKKLANAEGLYDMYGNVAEMCHVGETLKLCIMGTAWNRLDDFYTDGYSVDWLYGYSQYTVARNHVRESFPGFNTCGFRLCRSVADMPFAVTGISAPDVCDTYAGIVPVTIRGSGFLTRRTEPISVRVEGFATQTAGSVEWISDDRAIIPVQAEAVKIEGTQLATLRVIMESAGNSAEIEGTLKRVHAEFPLHPADILLDDGTVLSYEEGRVFSDYDKTHAAAVIIYAPYDGTEVLALGFTGWNPLSSAESIEEFLAAYGERAGIFGSYMGSGWYVPSDQELAPLSDSAFKEQIEGILSALEADSVFTESVVVPVKSIDSRALITQKYEYLTANDLLKEAAEQDAQLAAQMAAEEAAVQAAREAEEKAAREAAEAERLAREQAEAAEAAAEAVSEEQNAVAESEETEAAEESGEAEDEEKSSQTEARTLFGFGFDMLELTDSVQTVYAEVSTGLFIPYLYLSAEGNVTFEPVPHKAKIPYTHYSVKTYRLTVPYWDAAVQLGLSVRLSLGSFHPDLFVSGGVMTNSSLIDESRYVRARLEAGVDIPVYKKFTLTARYSADLDKLGLESLMDNYRLTAGFSIAFPSFILF